jgi:hypothetical protein
MCCTLIVDVLDKLEEEEGWRRLHLLSVISIRFSSIKNRKELEAYVCVCIKIIILTRHLSDLVLFLNKEEDID